MALVDMKRSKQEREKAGPTMAPGKSDQYGYGLNVELDHDHLQKLGIKKLPKAGTVLHLRAHAHVRNTSEHNDEDGKPRRSVSLQLRKMELQAERRAADDPEIQEGNLRGAKAAMDKALDAQEGSKKGSAKGSAKSAPQDDEDE